MVLAKLGHTDTALKFKYISSGPAVCWNRFVLTISGSLDDVKTTSGRACFILNC